MNACEKIVSGFEITKWFIIFMKSESECVNDFNKTGLCDGPIIFISIIIIFNISI